MKIFVVNNRSDEKVLRTKTEKFDFRKYDKKEVRELVKTMRAVMKEANGIGLSANQIGLNIQVFVAQVPSEKGAPKFYAMFNPKISKASKEKASMEEGCLSVPNKFGWIERSDKVVLEGQDANGKSVKIKAWGLLAQVFQHETDHLNGKLFIDRAKNITEVNEKTS